MDGGGQDGWRDAKHDEKAVPLEVRERAGKSPAGNRPQVHATAELLMKRLQRAKTKENLIAVCSFI